MQASARPLVPDLFPSPFAHFTDSSPPPRPRAQLLDEPDWDIYYWLTVRKPVPERWRASFETEGRLGWRLRKHTRNEERVMRTMPPLAQ